MLCYEHVPHSRALDDTDGANDFSVVGEKRIDMSGQPPVFGHGMLKYFGFAKDYINLNSGEYNTL